MVSSLEGIELNPLRIRKVWGMIVVNKSLVCNHYVSGRTRLNKSYRYVSPQRVWFLRLFGENRYILPFLVWNWVWFSRKLRECMNVFVVSFSNEKERKKEM